MLSPQLLDLILKNGKTGLTLVRTVNLMGQEIDHNYRGMVIDQFSDGSTLKESNYNTRTHLNLQKMAVSIDSHFLYLSNKKDPPTYEGGSLGLVVVFSLVSNRYIIGLPF